MAVFFNYDEELGKFTSKRIENGKENIYNLIIHNGVNCRFVCSYDVREYDDVKYDFIYFTHYNERQDLRREQKKFGYVLDKDIVSAELNFYYPNAKIIANMLIKNGVKVTIYYQEPQSN